MCVPVRGVVKVLINGVLWDPHQKNPIGKSENPPLPQKQGMCFNSVWCGFLETETQLLNGYIGCGVFVGSTAADSEFCGYVQQSAKKLSKPTDISLSRFCRYRIPSRSWVYLQGVPALFQATMKQLQEKLKAVVPSLTCDGWKSYSKQAVWIITAR